MEYIKNKHTLLLLITIGYSYILNSQSVVIEPSRVSGTAPLYVFFDATASTGISEGNDLVNSDFSWNFDVNNTDSNGNWEITKGMVSGHVFEEPGTYEISCTLTAPNGSTDTETLSIVVSAFEGTTYYVSNDGDDDDNDGLSESFPWRTAQHAFQQLSANERILFRRGDIFSGLSQNINNITGGAVIIGAYGSGDKPVLSGSNVKIIDIRNSEDIRVMDLHIIPTGSSDSEGFSSEESEHILALRLEIEQTTIRAFYQDEANLLGVFDCYLHDFGVLALFSGDGTRLSFVGNTVNNLLGAPQPEHGIRIQGGEKQFIAYNTFTRLDDTKTAMTIRGDGQRHVMIYRNIMDRILGVNPIDSETLSALSHVVIEGNYIGHNEDYVTNVHDPTPNAINIEATNIAIRNNVIDGYRNAIFVGHDYNGVVSGMVDVYNNTIHWRPVTEASGTSGRIVRVRDVSNVNIQNNLISATDVNDIEIVNNDAGSTNIQASNNLATSSPNYVAEILDGSAAHFNNVENYNLTENSPAVDIGSNTVPVFFDINQGLRPSGTNKDIGAFEYGSMTLSEPEYTSSPNNLIQVFPNPFSNEIFIQNGNTNTYLSAQLYNQLGMLIRNYPLQKSLQKINLHYLENGLYYLVLKDKNSVQTFKIIKE